MLKKWVLLGLAGVLIVALASCGSGVTSSTTAATGTTLSSTLDAERAFMKELAPDFISWVSVISDRRANKVTDEAVYAELQRLQQQWTGRQAPSTRTQAFLDGWLTDLGTCEKYWALIVKNDVAGAEAMRKEVDQAIVGAHLPETLSAILVDSGITTDDVREILTATTTVAPTTTTLPPVSTTN
jgi:hypothetical protein